MRKVEKWMMAAILICGSTMVFTSCSDKDDDPVEPETEQDGMNKKITDGNYDKSLAVKCINGTFVGKKTENVITYKGIPFVGQQPVGNLRWKAPVEYTANDGVYEAYYNAKGACQPEGSVDSQGEDCLYLNVWKTEGTSAEKKPWTCLIAPISSKRIPMSLSLPLPIGSALWVSSIYLTCPMVRTILTHRIWELWTS